MSVGVIESKRLTTQSVGKHLEEPEVLCTDSENVKLYNHYGKHTPNIWPSHSTPQYLPEKEYSISSFKDLYIIFIAALFVMARLDRNPTAH